MIRSTRLILERRGPRLGWARQGMTDEPQSVRSWNGSYRDSLMRVSSFLLIGPQRLGRNQIARREEWKRK